MTGGNGDEGRSETAPPLPEGRVSFQAPPRPPVRKAGEEEELDPTRRQGGVNRRWRRVRAPEEEEEEERGRPRHGSLKPFLGVFNLHHVTFNSVSKTLFSIKGAGGMSLITRLMPPTNPLFKYISQLQHLERNKN